MEISTGTKIWANESVKMQISTTTCQWNVGAKMLAVVGLFVVRPGFGDLIVGGLNCGLWIKLDFCLFMRDD